MKILATADLHGEITEELRHPQGEDLLIIAGDLAPDDCKRKDGIIDQENVVQWLNSEFVRFCGEHGRCEIPIVVIPGNHDRFIHERYQEIEWPHNVHFLCDQRYDAPKTKLKIYGAPWCPSKHLNKHIQSQIFEDGDGMLKLQFDKIPEGLDVLVTHAPPKTPRWGSELCSSVLMSQLRSMENPPRFVICGHVHDYGGQEDVIKADNGKTIKVMCVAKTSKLFDV